MTKIQIHEFERLEGQFESLYTEVSALVKKNPNDLINKFKLAIINQIIGKANGLLGTSSLPLPDFTAFSDESLPSNSDVVMVIGQYLSSLERFRVENIFYSKSSYRWCWLIGGKESNIETYPPIKLEKEKK